MKDTQKVTETKGKKEETKKLSEKYAGDPREPWEIKRDLLKQAGRGCYTPAIG